THMHDLARSVDALNEEVEGTSKAASLVTGVHDGERSFKVSLLPPQGVSYAKDIALKYGVSFRQIKESIDSRT
ncbi:MAG: DNA mismatch repair protein, partial [Ruminococcus sp.]|nr:DNA mismatch repair protein [Ruminococcus sp.]